MNSPARVTIHDSQFPENVRRDLLVSLRTRRVNHKFHYDSPRQTQQWLALHQAYSPSRNDAACAATYDLAFEQAARHLTARRVHVLGLGCGGGQKDTRLLKLLKAAGKGVSYTPCDVSTAMVLVARQAALAVLPDKSCFPFVCDLATAEDLPAALLSRQPTLVTFFGMIPNFEPAAILSKLSALVRPRDFLLFSANLAPGGDDAAGMAKILPQYDNALTRDWLLTFLLDLGVERSDGTLEMGVETGGSGLKRVVARFRFHRRRRFQIESKSFEFCRGEVIRLFFSYRYTPSRVRQALGRHGLSVLQEWVTPSGEEGVFLCARP